MKNNAHASQETSHIVKILLGNETNYSSMLIGQGGEIYGHTCSRSEAMEQPVDLLLLDVHPEWGGKWKEREEEFAKLKPHLDLVKPDGVIVGASRMHTDAWWNAYRCGGSAMLPPSTSMMEIAIFRHYLNSRHEKSRKRHIKHFKETPLDREDWFMKVTISQGHESFDDPFLEKIKHLTDSLEWCDRLILDIEMMYIEHRIGYVADLVTG